MTSSFMLDVRVLTSDSSPASCCRWVVCSAVAVVLHCEMAVLAVSSFVHGSIRVLLRVSIFSEASIIFATCSAIAATKEFSRWGVILETMSSACVVKSRSRRMNAAALIAEQTVGMTPLSCKV